MSFRTDATRVPEEILKQVQDDVGMAQDDTLICHPRLDLGSLSDATRVPEEILKQVQDDVGMVQDDVGMAQDDTLICHPRLDLGSLSDATRVPEEILKQVQDDSRGFRMTAMGSGRHTYLSSQA